LCIALIWFRWVSSIAEPTQYTLGQVPQVSVVSQLFSSSYLYERRQNESRKAHQYCLYITLVQHSRVAGNARREKQLGVKTNIVRRQPNTNMRHMVFHRPQPRAPKMDAFRFVHSTLVRGTHTSLSLSRGNLVVRQTPMATLAHTSPLGNKQNALTTPHQVAFHLVLVTGPPQWTVHLGPVRPPFGHRCQCSIVAFRHTTVVPIRTTGTPIITVPPTMTRNSGRRR
jgi:hypothetical protein